MTAAKTKNEPYYNKDLHLGCCSSPRSASDYWIDTKLDIILQFQNFQRFENWTSIFTIIRKYEKSHIFFLKNKYLHMFL